MKSKTLNTEIRKKLEETGIRQYEVAQYLKISLSTFQHWLMFEMPESRKKMIMQAINEINYHEKKGSQINDR